MSRVSDGEFGACPRCGTNLQKYDSEHYWWSACDECGKPVRVTGGSLEVIGCYHSGCFGYPMCSCKAPHKGDCPMDDSGELPDCPAPRPKYGGGL